MMADVYIHPKILFFPLFQVGALERYEPTLKKMAAEGLLEYEAKPFTCVFSDRNPDATVIEIHIN